MSNAPSNRRPDELIAEGIVVSVGPAGTVNIAPMGPIVDSRFSHLQLRPFSTSETYQNLRASGCGVFHVTDDVELLARAAVGKLDPQPALARIEGFACQRLADTCRWFAFRVGSIDNSGERVTIECEVVARGDVRPFFGFNRAKHAVVEAAILATRVGILPKSEIQHEMDRLSVPVAKTASEHERRAFEFLQAYIDSRLPTPAS